MRYRQDYCETHDIDWFATYRGVPIHVASNGMIVPDFIDSKTNKVIQRYVSRFDEMFQVSILAGSQNIESLYEGVEDARNTYLSSFVHMACLGFCSFDSIRDEYPWLEYRLDLVAMPQYHFRPDEIERVEFLRGLLPEIPEYFAQALGLDRYPIWELNYETR